MQATRIAALALVALACAPPPAPDPAASFARHCERAEQALDEGRPDEAEGFLARALPIATAAGRQSGELARVNLGLARLRRAQGNTQKARHYLGLARFATRAAHGEDSLEMARVELESSRQKQLLGLHEQAVTAIERALAIQGSHLPPDHPVVQGSLRDLAWAHHLASQYPRAVEIYEAILAAAEQQGESAARERAITLNRLAWIHERAALPEQAADYRRRAREILEGSDAGDPEAWLALGLETLASPDDGRRERMADLALRAERWIAERRLHREHFDFERQMLVSLRRLDRGMPLPKVESRLERDLEAQFVSFATPRPRRASRHRYALPFEPGTPRQALRTSEGAHGYERVLLHAVDFELPPGSPVLAAREGRVVRVIDGFEPPTASARRKQEDLRHGIRVNRVIVLHEDDTYATYQPLATGVEVSEGDRVARGQRLGRTANLRDGETPLLHFDVRRNGVSAGSGGVPTPEPVRVGFADVPHTDGVPLAGHAYEGSLPASPAPIAPRSR